MIAIVDYGMGNLGSIANMLKRVGAEAVISSNAATIERADKLILPGVGAFDSGMENLAERDLIPLGKQGAGELFLNSIDRGGMMQGYDLELIRRVSGAVSIPVVACDRAGRVHDLAAVVKKERIIRTFYTGFQMIWEQI